MGDPRRQVSLVEVDRRSIRTRGRNVVDGSTEPSTQPPSGWILPEQFTGPAPGYAYAGFWRRFWAFLLDGLILAVPSWIIALPIFLNSVPQATLDTLGRGMYNVDPTTGQLVVDQATYTAYFAAINSLIPLALGVTVVLGVLQMLYFAILWSRRGASLGQLALGVQVRNERDGSRISFGRGCLRYLGMLVSIYVLYIGLIWAAFDSRKQGWHDKIAGTVAIRRVR
jgi:uncharacterized RDD family membrane protein YckC